MSDLELIYFPIAGRAKAIRVVLAMGNVAFKDSRIAGPVYGGMLQAGEIPLETLPVLKSNGVVVSNQSVAIVRYAAALAGLTLTDVEEAFRGDEVVATGTDIADIWLKAAFSSPDTKPTNVKELIEVGFPFYAKHIESVLARGSGPFVGAKVSYVDIVLTCIVSYVVDLGTEFGHADPTVNFPKLAALFAAVNELPAMKNYQ